MTTGTIWSVAALLAVLPGGGFPQSVSAVPTTQLEITITGPCSKDKPGGGTLLTLLSWAYGMPEYLIRGPDWMRAECVGYTVVQGKPPLSQPTLQRELAKWLQLAAHKEYNDTDVFVLKLPADGTALKIQTSDQMSGRATLGIHSLKAIAVPISRSVGLLSPNLRRPVIDETGLNGNFTFDLKWNGPTDLPKAFKEQLGLELEAAKRPVEVLVVDHVE
jgi:uncharacterized protein (TIGR03435 family)